MRERGARRRLQQGRGAIVVDVALQQRQPLRFAHAFRSAEDGAAVDPAQLGEETGARAMISRSRREHARSAARYAS